MMTAGGKLESASFTFSDLGAEIIKDVSRATWETGTIEKFYLVGKFQKFFKNTKVITYNLPDCDQIAVAVLEY